MIDPDELEAWLRLLGTPGGTPSDLRRLLVTFGGPQRVFQVPEAARASHVGVAFAATLSTPPADLPDRLARTRAWLAGSTAAAPRAVLTLGDPAYPPPLLQIADPPLLLYAAGRTALLAGPSLAIVGSRHATAQGLDHARAFARHLSERGLTIVSGLARGIDGAAHDGALQGPGGTVAVVGTGLDIVFPRSHATLAQRIAHEGLLVSEYSLGSPPLDHHFPRRNRLIAGLTLGTLVVEAALPSGSLITARLAAEAGREVFAIPGSIHSPQARGCHWLIRQGAKLVEKGDDVLEELGALLSPPPSRPRPPAAEPAAAWNDEAAQAEEAGHLADDDATRAPPAPATPAGSERRRLLEAMGFDPVDLETLSARTGLAVSALGVALLDLELAGLAARLPGGRVQRRAHA